MNWRTTVALLVVVTALGFFVFLFERKTPSTDEAKKAAKMVVPGFKDERDKVSRIVIERPRAKIEETDEAKNGPDDGPIQRIELKKIAEEDWRITAPIAYAANQYRASGLISGLAYLEKSEVEEDVLAITSKEGTRLNPADYNLDPGNRIRSVYFGKEAAGGGEGGGKENEVQLAEVYLSSEKLLGGNSLYAALPELVEKEVYVVGTSLFRESTEPLDTLREHRVYGKFSLADVREATITRKDTTLSFHRDGLEWFLTKPVRDIGRTSTIEGAVRSVVSMFTKRFVEDTPADLDRYGLSRPRFRITIIPADGEASVLLIGRNVPPEDPEAEPEHLYAMLEGQPTVLSIPNDLLKEIEKPVNDYRFDKLLTIHAEKASRVVVERAGSPGWDIRLAKNDWKFVEPAPYDADESAVNELIADLKNISIKEYFPNVLPPSPEQQAAAGAVRVVVSFEETSNLPAALALLVPATEKEIQAWRLAPAGAGSSEAAFDPNNTFLIDHAAYDALTKPLLAYRSRDMASYDRDKATRIEITTPAGAHTAVKKGDKWKLDTPTGSVDSGRINDLLWRTSTLRAEALVAEISNDEESAKYGLAEGAVNLKVTAGKKTLDLLIGSEEKEGAFAMLRVRGAKIVFRIAGGKNGIRQLCLDGLLKGAKLNEPETKEEAAPEVEAPPDVPETAGDAEGAEGAETPTTEPGPAAETE